MQTAACEYGEQKTGTREGQQHHWDPNAQPTPHQSESGLGLLGQEETKEEWFNGLEASPPAGTRWMGPWLSTGTRCLTGRLVLGLSPGGLPLNTGKYDLLKAEWQGESMKSGYSTQRTEVSLAPQGRVG